MHKKSNRTVTPKLRFPEYRDAVGWKSDLIAEVATISKGRGISKADVAKDGTTPCIRYAELYTCYGEMINKVQSRTNISPGELVLSRAEDVILPASGETRADIATAACVMHEGVALGGDLNILRSDLHGPFFSYLLNSPLRHKIAQVAQGDTVAHLYPSQISKISVAYPSPAEQQKIAECLSSLDWLIAAEGRKLEALKAHKKGLMQRLFPQPGETQPRLRFPEFRGKGEWGEEKLSEHIELVSGVHLLPSDYSDHGQIPYFTGPSDFTNEESHVSKWTTQTDNKGVAHDILITVKGSGVGELWYLALPQAALGRQLMAVRPLNGVNRFYFQLLLSKRRLLEDLAMGNLIPGLSRGDILNMKTLLPSEAEQQKIATCLTTLDTRIAAQAAKIESLKQHKRGLMQQLFPAPEAS